MHPEGGAPFSTHEQNTLCAARRLDRQSRLCSWAKSYITLCQRFENGEPRHPPLNIAIYGTFPEGSSALETSYHVGSLPVSAAVLEPGEAGLAREHTQNPRAE